MNNKKTSLLDIVLSIVLVISLIILFGEIKDVYKNIDVYAFNIGDITLNQSFGNINSTLNKYGLKNGKAPNIVYFKSEEKSDINGFYCKDYSNFIFLNKEAFFCEDKEEDNKIVASLVKAKFISLEYPKMYVPNYNDHPKKDFYSEPDTKIIYSLADDLRLDLTILHEYCHLLQYKENLYFKKYNARMNDNSIPESKELVYDFCGVEDINDLNYEQEAELFSYVLTYRYLYNSDKDLISKDIYIKYYDYIISRFGNYIKH